MPNHCENTLSVKGIPYDVRKFARDHYRHPDNWDGGTDRHKTVLDFSKSVPYPESMDDRLAYAQSSHSGWYDFHCEHWGTKWNAYDLFPTEFPEVIKDCDDGDLTYTFNTAWSPPVAWLVEASKMYPDLTFTMGFVEFGCDFAGKIEVKNGICDMLEDIEPSAWMNITADMDDDEDAYYAEWDEESSKLYEILGF